MYTTFTAFYHDVIEKLVNTISSGVADVYTFLQTDIATTLDRVFGWTLPDWLPNVNGLELVFGGGVFVVIIASLMKWLTAPIT